VAEKQRDGTWRIFNGNEIGALFASWVWQCFKQGHPEADVSKAGMINSNVSSKFIKTMAEVEGFHVRNMN
jgi:phosphomannomutase